MVTLNFYFGSTPDFTRHHQKMTMFQQVFFESLRGDPVSKQPTHFKHWPTGVGGVIFMILMKMKGL